MKVVIVITTLATTDFRQDNTGGKRKSRLVAGKARGKKRKARLIKEIAVARTRAGNFDSIDKRRCFCSIDCA
jgi:hypothetical protein